MSLCHQKLFNQQKLQFFSSICWIGYIFVVQSFFAKYNKSLESEKENVKHKLEEASKKITDKAVKAKSKFQ